MKKSINTKLNIIEVTSFILCLLFMGIYLNNALVVKPIFMILGSICGFTFISIELFLLLIMNNKYRIISIIYILLSIIIGVIINTSIPYSVFLIITLCSLMKAIFRIIKLDKLYVGSRYKTYSKMFITEYNDIKKVFSRKPKEVKVTTKRKARNKAYAQKDLV